MNRHFLFQSRVEFFCLVIFILFGFSSKSQGIRPGAAYRELILTPYNTTLVANRKDQARIKLRVIHADGISDSSYQGMIRLAVLGDGVFVKRNVGTLASDSLGKQVNLQMVRGEAEIILRSGKSIGTLYLKAEGDSLQKAESEIHTIHPGRAHALVVKKDWFRPLPIHQKILGADISFLPELEARGLQFYNEQGEVEDAIQILKEHGFNYIRLRIFVHPDRKEGGYSPGLGFCDLAHTLVMAKRIKQAGMGFLLDFHYSDTWADPQKQFTPKAWSNLDYKGLEDSTYAYTLGVMKALKNQGTDPDMVQIGNEINHGLLWPKGAINNLDSLAGLVYAGMRGVKMVNSKTPIMLHIALGGQNEESRFFLDQMLARKVPFDIIGLSYYPRWHGSLEDLESNIRDLGQRYGKYMMVAEYSQLKKQVNKIALGNSNPKVIGSFIWEPLNTWESVFDRKGRPKSELALYPPIAKKYSVKAF